MNSTFFVFVDSTSFYININGGYSARMTYKIIPQEDFFLDKIVWIVTHLSEFNFHKLFKLQKLSIAYR